jgi:hypothetical protein
VAINPSRNIDQAFSLGTPIDEAMNDAVRDAVRQHQRMGLPLAVWRDGRTVWLLPEELTNEMDAQSPEVDSTEPS